MVRQEDAFVLGLSSSCTVLMYKYVYLPRVVQYLRISTSTYPVWTPNYQFPLELIETKTSDMKFHKGRSSTVELPGSSTPILRLSFNKFQAGTIIGSPHWVSKTYLYVSTVPTISGDTCM